MITRTERSLEKRQDPVAELEDRIARLTERERHLHSLLVDTRDALVRSEIARDPPTGRGIESAPGEPPGYAELAVRIRAILRTAVPAGSFALVVSRGDSRLLDANGAGRTRHFPCTTDGAYAGHHPADSDDAIAQLEAQRRAGAGLFVVPVTSLWWLDHYEGLARHLDGHYRKLMDDTGTCFVYDLRRRGDGASTSPTAEAGATATDSRRPFAAVSIISRNYLAHARVLANTFLQHEPECRFYLLVVDRLPEGVDVAPGVILVDPEELEIPGFYEMCFKYGIVEFNTAVKPYLLSMLLEKYGEEEVVYFDPDIMIMRPLEELRVALTAGDIVLTPHITRPLPLDGERPSEQDIMISGAYNLGFIALRRSKETGEFLEWWQERLEDGCRIDVSNGLFTDQKWIDLVPSLFPSTVILRNPTCNVAFWNLHEREISHDGEDFLVNGRPAGFFHISGFDPREPQKLSKHQSRVEVVEGSALHALLESYARLLFENGFDEASGWEYGYERFANGIRVHPVLRQIFLSLSPDERREFGDPFAANGAGSFLDWATRPRPEDGSLSPFLRTLYSVRYDLRSTFPDVDGRDRAAFLRWARRWGSAEMGFEPELVRDEETESVPAATDSVATTAPSRSRLGETSSQKLSYAEVTERIRNIARSALPAGSRVLVISKGDYRLVDLGGAEGWHFPQTEDGRYGGFHPPNSSVAISQLEELRGKGADYLLIPQSALWWLEHYEEFRTHLESRFRLVVQDYESCLIYSLRGSNGRSRGVGSQVRLWWTRLRHARRASQEAASSSRGG